MQRCTQPFSRRSDAMGTPGSFAALVKASVGVALAFAMTPAALASSHREAPFISGQPKVDGTDLYMFRSYETGRQNFVTVLANYQPFQDPQGGPNFAMFDPDALYEIHIDNNGDAVEDLSFQFRFKNTSKATALNIGGKQVKIPLINSDTITGVNPASLNVRETFTIDLVRGGRRTGSRNNISITNSANGLTTFDKPVDNIGDKTFASTTGYATYAGQHIYNVAIPGCSVPGRVFVGQRKEPFFIAVELVAAREVRHRLVELAHGQIAMTAPPVEHRFIRRDGESACERCDGLAELTGSRLRDTERDEPLHVARIGVECRFRARDWSGVRLRAVGDSGRTAILHRLRAGRGDCDRQCERQ